jgi:hypothetical protein
MLSLLKYIVSYCIISAIFLAPNVLFAQLYISPGAALTIKNGTSLYVGTDLTIKSNSSNSGYLVDQTMADGVVVTGNILIERYLSSVGWHNVSAPLSNANSSLFTGTDLIFYFDETLVLNDWNFGWVWYSGNLSVMRGYDVFLPSTPVTTQYSTTNPSQLNSGSYTIGVTFTNVADGETPNHKGWNLLGNPYPSPVDWLIETAWNKTSINDAKYIWDPVGNIYTIFLGGGSPIGLNGGTQYIPSNQGFWVQAVQNGNVQLDNSARVGLTPSTPDFYKSTDIDYPVIRLVAEGNGFKDETIIRFIDRATDEFDRNLDALKLFSPNQQVPQLASQHNNSYLAVNTLHEIQESLIVPLYFNAGQDGTYSIRLTEQQTLISTMFCYLFDSKIRDYYPLKIDSAYTFEFKSTDNKNRFSLIFSSDDEPDNIKKEDYKVFTNGELITINHISETNKNVHFSIYNMVGQRITYGRLNLQPTYSFRSDLPAACYIFEILDGEMVSRHKITIN